jgi:ankyrin repeat protein
VERKCVALLAQNTSNAAEYKSTLPSRVDGTCKWILSNSQYRDWNLQKRTCLLWISGYPGSGKTILSSYLLDYLSAGELSPSLRTTLCYFFCDEKIDTQRDGKAILRSLIHQLLMRRRLLVKYVKAVYDIQGPQFEQNFNELWRIFIVIASVKRVGPISVIIDAIDECEETTRERFLQEVNKLVGMSGSASSNIPRIKFLVTSRPLLGRQYATNLLQIDPSQDHVERDLRLVIQTKVEGIVQRTKCKRNVREYLENALYSKADRTFLWVTLVLHLLETSLLASQRDFKEIIDQLPKTLTATYERFLYGISTQYQPLATRLLHFLVGSSRPLTLAEMRALIAVQDYHRTLSSVEEDAQPNIRETIEGVLGPLVRIWDSRIYLVHQSLKEFLQTLSTQTDNPLSSIYGIDPRKASLLLADACVSYLLLDDFEQDLFSRDQPTTEDSPTSLAAVSTDNESIEQLWDPFNLGEDNLFKDPAVLEAEACASIGNQYILFDYAARHWTEHFLLASSISLAKLQKSVLQLSNTTSSNGLNWFRFYWFHAEIDLSCRRDFVPIVSASYFGHATSLKSLLQKDFSIEADAGTLAIYWASRMGHHDVVDLLLHEGVSPDVKFVDGQSALIAAVQFNRIYVVKSLLKGEGYIPEEKCYRVNHTALGGRTALSIAAGNGHIEIVRQLLQHDQIQPDIADSEGWSPLFWSISGNHLDVLQLLHSDNRISVNHVDKSGHNILSCAASGGKLELVKYLLSIEHLSVNEPDRTGRTELSWAAGNGHLETTACLRRSQRIDVSIKDRDGRNALSWASSGGHYRVVEYLIKHDRQGVDEEDVDGWAPLAWALFNRTPKTVQVLLDSGLVDVNKKDKYGRSALSFAAGYGYLDVVQILLNMKGIEIDSKDNDGRTPLSHATRYPDVVAALKGSSK